MSQDKKKKGGLKPLGCLATTIDIVKAYAGSGNADPKEIPKLIEPVYKKVVDVTKKALEEDSS